MKVEGVVVIYKSTMQNTTILSVTESETVSRLICIQDMVFAKNMVNLIGVKVKHPMVLEFDNEGTFDMTHILAVTGRIKHR